METTTVSSKFQLVVPKAVREQISLKPGQRFVVVAKGDVIELVPVGDIRELRGVLRGSDPTGLRDRSDTDG